MENLNEVLEDHKKWISGTGGKKADLRGADLRGADLRGADLREADLSGANLRGADLHWANLSGADLRWADLSMANLRGANLSGANLRGADLHWANLSMANLREANLSMANLDMSCWPLWCGSLGVKIDEKLKKQLMYHVIDACGSDMFTDEQVEFANGFHRVGEIHEVK
jgi:hypothetical protein